MKAVSHPVQSDRSSYQEIEIPELPDARKQRFIEDYGLSPTHAATLTGDWQIAEFYDSLPGDLKVLTSTATWVADTLLGELNYRT